MINDVILFARLAETNLASYGSRLKGMCEVQKIYSVIELLRLYSTNTIPETIPYCGWTQTATFEMFCSDILNMTSQELQEMTEQILHLRAEHPLKRTYIIPRKISEWIEEIYHEFIQDYPSERIRNKFRAMYYNADRFYDTLLFHPEKAFYFDIDPEMEVVKEIWQFTIYVAQYLTDNILKSKRLPKTDAFKRKCEEFVENLHICHLEAYNRLNYHLCDKSGQFLIQDVYSQRVNAQDGFLRSLIGTPEAMARIIFGHPEMVWNTFDGLDNKTRPLLKEQFESLYTLMAQLAHHLPKENDKLYLNQMFGFLEPYQQDRVMEYIRDNDNTPILYLILAYVRSRPTGSYMDVLARFNGFFGPEQTIEQIASSLGTRRNKIVSLFQKPEPDKTLSRIASYPQAKRYNLSENDWIDLTDPKSVVDNDERALIEKLGATDEALYYALSTLCQVELVPILDRMVGISVDLAKDMDFSGAITYLWKTKFRFSETSRTLNIPEIISRYIKVLKDEIKEEDLERIERVFIALVRLIMPDLQLGYPNIVIEASKVNAENELFRFVSLMKEISLENLFDIFTSNYPQFNLRHPQVLIPVIELSGKIGYNSRKRKFMPSGPKTVEYPYDHIKDTAIEDRSWVKYQDINGVDEPQIQMQPQGTKTMTYAQITESKTEEVVPRKAPILKETTDIKSALEAALAISAKLTDVDSIVETSTEYGSQSLEGETTETTPALTTKEDRIVSFENEEPVLAENPTLRADEEVITLDNPDVTETQNVNEEVVKEIATASASMVEPKISDILEDFGTHIQSEEPASQVQVEELVSEAAPEEKVEAGPITEKVSEELPESQTQEQPLSEVNEQVEIQVEQSEPQSVEEKSQPVEEISEDSVTQEREQKTVEETSRPIEEETAALTVVEESIPPLQEEPSHTKEELLSVAQGDADSTDADSTIVESQTREEEVPQAQNNTNNAAEGTLETEEAKAEIATFAPKTQNAVPEALSTFSEGHESRPSTPSVESVKTKKTTKEIVGTEPQAQMSPYRQSKVLEDKKAEEERLEKEKSKGKRGRKPMPKPDPSLPLKENIVRVLRNNKSPMTLSNIVKSLRKAGVTPEEDDVADIIYKFDKELFLFFMMNFIGLMEKKYNFKLFRLDPNSSQTFEYMGRAFFAFCDNNGRMPFMDDEEEKFLDRWVSHLLDEKVKCTPQQMKWFRQQVISRRGKVLNKDEWTFAENCRMYRKFYQDHKTHPDTNTEPRLYRWFNKISQTYNTLNEIKRSEFDSLVEYLDQFGLFGLFD